MTEPNTNASIARVIRNTVNMAKERGADSISQYRIAMTAVRMARPDMTESEVWTVVAQVLAA